jgi:hypothetical protein
LSTKSQGNAEREKNRIKYFAARDTFLGINEKYLNMEKGLALARSCAYDEAQWLCQLFPPTDVPYTAKDARSIFLAQGPGDARALCYAAVMLGSLPYEFRNDKLVEKEMLEAASMGNALAQAWVAEHFVHLPLAERLELAKRSAAQNEPAGLVCLGQRLVDWDMHQLPWAERILRSRDAYRADVMLLFKQAAQMGHPHGQYLYGQGFHQQDPERYLWMAKASENGCYCSFSSFAQHFCYRPKPKAEQAWVVPILISDETPHALLFAVGGAMKACSLPRCKLSKRGRAEVTYAVAFHDKCLEKAKAGIMAWSLVARRKGCCKDVRLSIARMVWASRAEWHVPSARTMKKMKVGFSFYFARLTGTRLTRALVRPGPSSLLAHRCRR